MSRAPALDFPSFRSQESVLILLNLGAMAGLMALHALFRPVIGGLTVLLTLAFVVRFAMQLGELAFLNDPRTALGARATWWYARLSVMFNVAFVALVSRHASGQESHHAVLMVVPVIAAAFRFSMTGLVELLAAAVALSIAPLWLPHAGLSAASRLTESFEATTVSLIFLVVAAVVRLLADQHWDREAELQRSLSALAAARDRLVREEKLAAVGRVASAIAHEVRNPVSMIASAVATLRRPETSAELRDELFGILGQESRRLERLTQDFLTYARHRPPQPLQTSLREALGLVGGLVRARAEELGVELRIACEDAPMLLDPFQLQQALLNLALNALDATPRGGYLRLTARAELHEAVFGVENSGPAIPPDSVARLGEPFFTTKAHGSGLGLAIARSIAQAHGGELTLAGNTAGCVRFELRVREGGPV